MGAVGWQRAREEKQRAHLPGLPSCPKLEPELLQPYPSLTPSVGSRRLCGHAGEYILGVTVRWRQHFCGQYPRLELLRQSEMLQARNCYGYTWGKEEVNQGNGRFLWYLHYKIHTKIKFKVLGWFLFSPLAYFGMRGEGKQTQVSLKASKKIHMFTILVSDSCT